MPKEAVYMSAYVVGNYTIHDEKQYMHYVQRVGQTVAAYGGRTLVADHAHAPLEVQPSQVIVVVEFESQEKAEQWYASAAYQDIVHYRRASSEGWVSLCRKFARGGVSC